MLKSIGNWISVGVLLGSSSCLLASGASASQSGFQTPPLNMEPPAPPPPPPPLPPPPLKEPIPLGNSGDWIKEADYPKIARKLELQGVTALDLLLSKRGNPYACYIVQTSGAHILDQKACSLLMSRARFEPRTESDGRKRDSLYHMRVRWNLTEYDGSPSPPEPADYPAPANPVSEPEQWIRASDLKPIGGQGRAAQEKYFFKLGVSSTGRVSSCEIIKRYWREFPNIEAEDIVCGLLQERAKFEPLPSGTMSRLDRAFITHIRLPVSKKR